MSPLTRLITNGMMTDGTQPRRAVNGLCKLADLLRIASDFTFRDLQSFRGPPAAFSYVSKHVDPPLEEINTRDRASLATHLFLFPELNAPEIFKIVLQCNPVPIDAASYSSEYDGQTLLHTATAALGKLIFWTGYRSTLTPFPDDCDRWRPQWESIIFDLITAGANPCAIMTFDFCELFHRGLSSPCSTPLLTLFGSGKRAPNHIDPPLDPSISLHIWITILYNAGVNLVEYGRREQLIWQSFDVIREWGTPLDNYENRFRFVGFTYGRLPNDWRIWLNEPTDQYVGDFWMMLDKRIDIMPGTWID